MRETAWDPLRRALWELIYAADSRLDTDDVIQTLEEHGWHCPDNMKDE